MTNMSFKTFLLICWGFACSNVFGQQDQFYFSEDVVAYSEVASKCLRRQMVPATFSDYLRHLVYIRDALKDSNENQFWISQNDAENYYWAAPPAECIMLATGPEYSSLVSLWQTEQCYKKFRYICKVAVEAESRSLFGRMKEKLKKKYAKYKEFKKWLMSYLKEEGVPDDKIPGILEIVKELFKVSKQKIGHTLEKLGKRIKEHTAKENSSDEEE